MIDSFMHGNCIHTFGYSRNLGERSFRIVGGYSHAGYGVTARPLRYVKHSMIIGHDGKGKPGWYPMAGLAVVEWRYSAAMPVTLNRGYTAWPFIWREIDDCNRVFPKG